LVALDYLYDDGGFFSATLRLLAPNYRSLEELHAGRLPGLLALETDVGQATRFATKKFF